MEHTKKHARIVFGRSLLLLTLTFNLACKSDSSTNSPDTNTSVVDTGELTPGATRPLREGYYIDQIKSLANNSTCSSYAWSGRSKAPKGYTQGMALTYARSFCRLKSSQINPANLASILTSAAGNSSTDALALYATNLSNLSMDVTRDGNEALLALYTLGIGLGMRESSGKYCEGRDMSASNTSANTAEAGMFQTSYDSIGASSELSKLYAEYQADTSKCFLDVFKQGASCGSSSIAGSGAGATYQAFNKSCPAFAAEYAMVMLRVRRNHYGPINRKEAELSTVCHQMFKSVEDLIESDIYACDEIM